MRSVTGLTTRAFALEKFPPTRMSLPTTYLSPAPILGTLYSQAVIMTDSIQCHVNHHQFNHIRQCGECMRIHDANRTNKMLSYRKETAWQGALVMAKSGRLELEENILRTS